MPNNPYAGLSLVELNKIRAHCLAILTGENFQQSGGQGSNFTRFRWTPDEARQNLAMVNEQILALNGTVSTDRTVFRSSDADMQVSKPPTV